MAGSKGIVKGLWDLASSKFAKVGARRAVREGAEGAAQKKTAAEAAELLAQKNLKKSLTETKEIAKAAIAKLPKPDWEKGLFRNIPTAIGFGFGVLILVSGSYLLGFFGLLPKEGLVEDKYENLLIYGTGTIIVVSLLKAITDMVKARNETKLIDAREERLIKAISLRETPTPTAV